jgi:hypothetical protein
MSNTEEFWQYAKEAALSASYTEDEEERQTCSDLARTWVQAALMERRSLVDTGLYEAALERESTT